MGHKRQRPDHDVGLERLQIPAGQLLCSGGGVMGNYSLGIKPLPDVENGHTFTGDNFLQLLPHTKIFDGKAGLTFVSCNLTNCDIPADSVCVMCRPVQLGFCSHVHPNLVKRGLPECAVNCEHVVDTDTITIDGVVVDTVYHYDVKAVE